MRKRVKWHVVGCGARSRASVLAVSLWMALCLPCAAALAQNVNPGIAPPQSKPLGLSGAEWSVRWWRWALETPTDENPLFDMTGRNCAVGQTGHVWFLAGTLGPTEDPVHRSCAIPAGTTLFFPVANAFCVAEGDGSLEAQRECVAQSLSAVTSVQVQIDGVAVRSLASYRFQSPPFDLILPSDNIFGAPAGLYTPTAADGLYLTVRPLPPGEHTIHIRTEFGTDSIDVTYQLTMG
jgi:hypothetical protein